VLGVRLLALVLADISLCLPYHKWSLEFMRVFACTKHVQFLFYLEFLLIYSRNLCYIFGTVTEEKATNIFVVMKRFRRMTRSNTHSEVSGVI
jgi:hypothetical protein